MVLKIAINSADGVHSPSAVLLGVESFLKTYNDKLCLSLYGDVHKIKPFLLQVPVPKKCFDTHNMSIKFAVNATLFDNIKMSHKTILGTIV